jgi:hypothetical protein
MSHSDTDDPVDGVQVEESVYTEKDKRIAELETEVKQVKNELMGEIEDLRATVETLQQRQQNADSEYHPHQLSRLAAMDVSERRALLGPDAKAKRRAVKVYEHWDDLAWKLGSDDNPKYGMDTNTKANKKHQPAKIGVELRKLFDTDLSWNQIYRVMRALAKLSGGIEHVDDYDRTHITGGEFKFEQRPTTDGSDTRKVVYRRSGWSE